MFFSLGLFGWLGFFSLVGVFFKPFRRTFEYESASFTKLTHSEITCHAKKHRMAYRTGMPQFREVFNKVGHTAVNPLNPL